MVVTSYQLVVSDIKYFSRVDWQCMVLDEAQAIKSTSRWAGGREADRPAELGAGLGVRLISIL